MQKKKLFIEIEVPQSVKKRIFQRIEKWQNLPVKWEKDSSLHITVLFIGYVDESVIPDICTKVRRISEKFEMFDLEFEKITLGPNHEDPKVIWAQGKTSEELKNLNEALEKELGVFVKSRKEFRPHITIGRIRKHKWEELEKKPQIEENLSIALAVEHIDVMESRGGGAEYIPIETCPLM